MLDSTWAWQESAKSPCGVLGSMAGAIASICEACVPCRNPSSILILASIVFHIAEGTGSAETKYAVHQLSVGQAAVSVRRQGGGRPLLRSHRELSRKIGVSMYRSAAAPRMQIRQSLPLRS